ncbi:S53 family peptidase [Conexibacter woesei]|uniref:S53 family peptidase n=1 Tax=Conexibacter woesei TaxID=191495 RepID=UPI000411DEBC|nr:S53 family peptidase [Conexibacter woesei]
MSNGSQYVELPGSERQPLPGARRVADAPPDEPVDVTVLLRRKDGDATDAFAAHAEADPVARGDLSVDQLGARFGAADDDVEKVERFAKDHGLEVVDESAAQRRVLLRGPAAAMGEAFGVSLGRYENDEGLAYRGREGAVQVPADLEGVVTAVLGLDDRPQARPRLVRAAAAAPPRAFAVPEIAKLYNFPTSQASGQWVAIIELGGGFRQADLDTYFRSIGMPTPTVEAIPVGRGRNDPGRPADGEVMLDIEVVGAVAPGVRIAVYFAENTTAGFVNAILAAAHDTARRPSVFSISWGSAEENWTPQAVTAMNQAFADAGFVGMTVTAAAGDDGARDGSTDGTAQADFPASSPLVLGCGGTRLLADGGRISGETVWNDGPDSATGGGVSERFAVPTWQTAARVDRNANPPGKPGRGVPDVAGVGDPETGYRIRVDGRDAVFGGTSAVAPLWAGLIALYDDALRTRLGFLNPAFYRWGLAGQGFHDITQGNNIVPGAPGYTARAGWDACTGLGSPDGQALLARLRGGTAA